MCYSHRPIRTDFKHTVRKSFLSDLTADPYSTSTTSVYLTEVIRSQDEDFGQLTNLVQVDLINPIRRNDFQLTNT